MDMVLITAGLILLVAGLAGAVLPVIPGPPLSFAGILIFHLTTKVQYSVQFLVVTGIVAVVITLLDYLIPAYFTKKSKASRASTHGTILGTLVGLFVLPPLGILIFPVIGAFVGEVFVSGNFKKAVKCALAGLMGLMSGILLKLAFGLWALIYGVFSIF
ncbi:MAG: DUF456 domain-containing protein [Thermaurantimonas sp.]